MADETVWTVKDALEWTTGFLERRGDMNPRLSSEKLMSHATGLTRIEVYANYDRPLASDERALLRDAVKRRGEGEPLQYIIGQVGFRHIDVLVRTGVLIPRPETEVLVSEVLAELPAATRPRAAEYLTEPQDAEEGKETNGADASFSSELESDSKEEHPTLLVADLCTGSGCIACSLAYEHPQIQVVATDLSSEACELARENVSALGLDERINVIECDLGDGVSNDLIGFFDAVAANPPYIPTAVMTELPKEVGAFEPELALHGGTDGLDVFRRIVDWAIVALRPFGLLAVELHETCLEAAAEIARGAGLCEIRITRDLAGKPRVLTCRKGK